jgi:hypothetical protein
MKPSSSPLLRASSLERASRVGVAHTVTEFKQGRVLLQGLILPPWRDHQVVLEVSAGNQTQRLAVEDAGPWPRPFQLTEDDLPALTLVEDVKVVVLYLQDGAPRRRSSPLHVPLRCTGLRLRADQGWIAPVVVPTREEVEALPPAEPTLASAAVDVQGVVVVDGEPTVTLRLRHAGGETRRTLSGPSPVRFRIQLEEPLASDSVELQAVANWGQGRIEVCDVQVPVRSDGQVLWPGRPEPSQPVTCHAVEVSGTLDLSFLEEAESVTLAVQTAFGVGPTLVLDGPVPQAFVLSGGEFSHLPLLTPRVALLVTVRSASDEHAEMMAVEPVGQDVMLQPNRPRLPEPVPPKGLRRPVYGNTKGPQYPAPLAPKK